MVKQAFDLEKYLTIQKEEILKRIASFDDKLYIEFGGKLFDDYHASRVLPGFKIDTKLQLLLTLKSDVEMVIVINSKDITNNKIRNDTGMAYKDEVERLIDIYSSQGLYIKSVVLSFYEPSEPVDIFIRKLKKRKIKVYKHYRINGYPKDIASIVSEEGLGKNEYIETTKRLVVVTAPGPGSGKMETCLTQLYHDNKRGIRAGYAKYETFPIWSLPLSHPVNLAYEAATLDLSDVNMIDPFHLEKYGKTAVNYNRDVEAFPLLKAIFDKIYGKSPYFSPTDMGVNMAGFAISDDKAAREASNYEIIRRHYQVLKENYYGVYSDDVIIKSEMLMNRAGVSVEDRPCIKAANDRKAKEGEEVCAIEIDGKIITGIRSNLLGSPAALLLNVLKNLAGIDHDELLLKKDVLEPIQELKVNELHNHNPRLHTEEVLIALAISCKTSDLARRAYAQIGKLKGCDAHSTAILPAADLKTYKKLGINITEEPHVILKSSKIN